MTRTPSTVKTHFSMPEALKRFDTFVPHRPDGECWLWTGAPDKDGYGVFSFMGGRIKAHRFAYQRWVGTIPKGLLVRHLVCDNPTCVNPVHLAPGTTQDNANDRERKCRGVVTRGVDLPQSKLIESDVVEIRQIYRHRIMTQQELADTYGVSRSNIHMVVNRKSWRHI